MIITINNTMSIMVNKKEYFFTIFIALSPNFWHKITSNKNLDPLDKKLNIKKIGKEIPITPEVIAAILYGIGVNPAIKIKKYP